MDAESDNNNHTKHIRAIVPHDWRVMRRRMVTRWPGRSYSSSGMKTKTKRGGAEEPSLVDLGLQVEPHRQSLCYQSMPQYHN